MTDSSKAPHGIITHGVKRSFITYGLRSRRCIPPPSPSPLIQIYFNFCLTNNHTKWIQDQDSIRLSEHQTRSINSEETTAVANVTRLSFQEISEPIKKVLQPRMYKSWVEDVTKYAWEKLCEIESEITAVGNNVVNIAFEVVMQDHRLFFGRNDCFITETSCCVCLESLSGSGATPKLPLGLPCSHVFHLDCIQKWLEKSGSCPVCGHDLPRIAQYLNLIRHRGSVLPWIYGCFPTAYRNSL